MDRYWAGVVKVTTVTATDNHPQHVYYHKASDSWCFNQAAVAQVPTAEPKHDNAGRTSLSPDVAQKMLPFYKRS